MSSDSNESEVRRFYEEASIPDSRLDAMLDHGRSIANAARWKRVAGVSAFACLIASLTCGFLWIRLARVDQELQVAKSELHQILDADDSHRHSVTLGQSANFQLVAIRHHGDRCPGCRAAGETFDMLKRELAGTPVDFTLVDLRQDSEEVSNKLTSLEMDSLIDDRRHKVMVALRSPSGTLTELNLSDQTSSSIRQQVAKLIEHQE